MEEDKEIKRDMEGNNGDKITGVENKIIILGLNCCVGQRSMKRVDFSSGEKELMMASSDLNGNTLDFKKTKLKLTCSHLTPHSVAFV